MLQPANFSISRPARRTGTRGRPPAARRASTCRRRASRSARCAGCAAPAAHWRPPVPSSSPSATRARRSVGLVAVRRAARGSAAIRATRRRIADQFGERALQRLRHLQQHQDRGVADAVFQVRQVALGDVGAPARQRPCASCRGARAATRTRSPERDRGTDALTLRWPRGLRRARLVVRGPRSRSAGCPVPATAMAACSHRLLAGRRGRHG